MSDVFFRAEITGDRIKTTGSPCCALGHELPMGKSGCPDGVFAKWSWEADRFCIQNDRYGYYPLFYFAGPRELSVSPSIPKLLELGAPRDYDDTALAVFLRLGYFLGEDTPFRFIRAVPANATFEWAGGRLQVSGHQYLAEPIRVNRQQAVDGYISLFRQAIQRRLIPNEDFAVPLSGGGDSRHILLELCRIGHRPKFCATFRHFPPRNNSDPECAAKLCARAGVPHIVLDQPCSKLKPELRKNLKTSFCADEHTQYMVLADYLKNKVRAVYDGLGSSAFKSSYLTPRWLESFRRLTSTDFAREILHPSSEPVLKNLLSAEGYKRFGQEAAIARLAPELERLSQVPDPPGTFSSWNWTRREISLAPYAIYEDIPWVLSPYLDHDLFDFMMSLPADLLVDRSLQIEAIGKEYPQYADLPYETHSPIPFSFSHYQRYARELLEYAALKGPCRLIRRSYLFPRLFRCLVEGDYLRSAAPWLLTPVVAYLIQLDRATEGNATEF